MPKKKELNKLQHRGLAMPIVKHDKFETKKRTHSKHRWERETKAMTQENKLTFIEGLIGARSSRPMREAISTLFPLGKPKFQNVN